MPRTRPSPAPTTTTRIGASGTAPRPSWRRTTRSWTSSSRRLRGRAAAGRPAGAAAALQRAAELTADDTRRGALLLRAAELEYDIGRHEVAVRQLHEARRLVVDEASRLRVSLLLEVLESGWSGAEKVPDFVTLAEELQAAGETAAALDVLTTVALRCWWGNPDQETRDRVVDVVEGLTTDDHAPRGARRSSRTPIRSVGDGSCASASRGRRSTPPIRWQCSTSGRRPRASGRRTWQCRSTRPRSTASVPRGVSGSSRRRSSRTPGRPSTSPTRVSPLRPRRRAHGSPPRPDRGGGPSQRCSRRRPWPPSEATQRARMSSSRLRSASCSRWAANPMLSLVQFARGRAAIAQSQYSEAFEHLRRVFDPADIAYHPFIGGWAVADFLDAAVHGGGEIAAAHTVFATYEEIAERTGAPLLLAQVGYVRPLLAPDDDAGPVFQRALEDPEVTSWRCYRARLLLRYGAWLRRQRRVAESRAPLRAAAQAFDALGFEGMSERARQELRASGETQPPSRRRGVEPALAAGAPDRADGGRGPDEPGDRRAALPLAPHDRIAPVPNLPRSSESPRVPSSGTASLRRSRGPDAAGPPKHSHPTQANRRPSA